MRRVCPTTALAEDIDPKIIASLAITVINYLKATRSDRLGEEYGVVSVNGDHQRGCGARLRWRRTEAANSPEHEAFARCRPLI